MGCGRKEEGSEGWRGEAGKGQGQGRKGGMRGVTGERKGKEKENWEMENWLRGWICGDLFCSEAWGCAFMYRRKAAR